MMSVHPMLAKEEESWDKHGDIEKRAESSDRLSLFDTQTHLKLCYYFDRMYQVQYKHYFLLTIPDKYVIEFHGTDHFNSSYEIHNKTVHKKYFVVTLDSNKDSVPITKDIRTRFASVQGMCNYSLLLRNCEHVSKYVVFGKWLSLQIHDDTVFSLFLNFVTKDVRRRMNTAPTSLFRTPATTAVTPLSVEIEDNWLIKPLRLGPSQSFEGGPDSLNVLLIGPTGAGKSNIINYVYNKEIAPSKMQACGVTQSIQFYHGTYQSQPKQADIPRESGELCIIDTVGFCDAVMPLEEIVSMVKHVLKNQDLKIHRVLLVFGDRARDAELNALKQYKSQLQYKKHEHLFSLILTRCEHMEEAERQEYASSFHEMPDKHFSSFKRTELGTSCLTGERIHYPLTTCVGLIPFGRIKDKSTAAEERNKLLSAILHFGRDPIVFGDQGCCSIL